MATPAVQSVARAAAYGDFDLENSLAATQLSPDDRIGAPYRQSSRRASRWGTLILLASLGGAWATFGLSPDLTEWLALLGPVPASSPAPTPTASGAAPPAPPLPTAQVEPTPPDPAPQPVVVATPEPLPAPSSVIEPAATPEKSAGSVKSVSPITTASLAAPGAPPALSRQAPLTAEPAPPPVDPLQKRAVAVGLHPDLSRSLLERLSSADYRNAAVAIKTALAEPSDTAVVAWPKQRKAEHALFKVRFVAGAAPGCRRYVVTITKDGWLTTALPVEKCGADAGRPRKP